MGQAICIYSYVLFPLFLKKEPFLQTRYPLFQLVILFKLLRQTSKAMLLSAVREANRMKVFKTRYVQSLLQVVQPHPPNPLYPQETRLLEIDYERKNLKYYDELL